jgi:uncharacterized protein YegP (UPF0339 family)
MPSIVEYYQDTNRQWRWRCVATNGKIVANSAEGYHNRQDCEVGYTSSQTHTAE